MQEAAGLLEVFGCVAAFAAADAAAKAANVTIQSIDKNKPANADALPVPLITCLKIRGSVADVEAAMDAASRGSRKYHWCGIPIISSPVRPRRRRKMLRISAI